MWRKSLLFLVFLIPLPGHAQKDNALPPGPSTISGKVVDVNGEPLPGAKVTVLYRDGVQRAADTFHTNAWGYFTAYVFRYDQEYIELQIKLHSEVCQTIRYDNPGRGVNLEMGQRAFLCEMDK